MIETIDQYIYAEQAFNTNLALLVGTSAVHVDAVFEELCSKHEVASLNIGILLSKALNGLTQKQRCLMAGEILQNTLAQHSGASMVFIKNLEVLFDSSLKLDPLDLLKRNARSRKLIAIWPGQLQERHLVYAEFGHVERRSYSLDGIFTFEINS